MAVAAYSAELFLKDSAEMFVLAELEQTHSSSGLFSSLNDYSDRLEWSVPCVCHLGDRENFARPRGASGPLLGHDVTPGSARFNGLGLRLVRSNSTDNEAHRRLVGREATH